METNIQKWGNSLGIRLPIQLANKKSIKAGSRVVIVETKTGLAIEIIKEPEITLDSLVSLINESNIHQEVDWGKKVGKEIW